MQYYLYQFHGEKKFSGRAVTENERIVETTKALKRFEGRPLLDLMYWAAAVRVSMAVRAVDDDQWHRLDLSMFPGYFG